MTVPVETILARNTARRAVWVGPLLVVGFWVARGWVGAWSAAFAVGLVVVNFWLAGAMLSLAIKLGLAVYHAAALFGFFLRLALVVGVVVLVAALVEVDRPAFGISAVIAYMVLLTAEAVSVARGRERELDWVR
ncbi:MAG: hypothetical protein KatS3mg011_0782 [Acidimicrobiia bacterium]|jgi:hypothetical protein|nr:MAG: hypothetical protein KatS3mg011_0782 [Acidimicrobiia bacterium]